MSTVTVSFTALPEHVRTARFIAASVARRAGVSDELLDEVRLAVSEACSMAVRQHRVFAPSKPVELALIERDTTFSVRISDAVPRPGPSNSSDSPDGEELLELSQLVEPGPPSLNGHAVTDAGQDDEGVTGGLVGRERIGLAVIDGLVDDVDIDYAASGVVLTMTWPLDLDDYLNIDPAGSAPFGVL